MRWQDILDSLSEPLKTVFLLNKVYRLAPADIAQRMHIPSSRVRKLMSTAINSANRFAEIKKIKDAYNALESLGSFLNSSDLETYRHVASLIEPIKCSLLDIITPTSHGDGVYPSMENVILHRKLQEMLETGDAQFICTAINILHSGILETREAVKDEV